MAKIKEASSYDGSAWGTAVPIGANATNIDMATNPTDYDSSTSETSTTLIGTNDVKVISSDTDLTAWGKFNRFRKRADNAITDLKNTLKRNYILIGDSFSIGYTKETSGSSYHQSDDGWAIAFKRIFTAKGHQVYNTNDITAQVAGTTGFASSLPFLTLLQAIEEHVPDNNVITDIVVLGGSNDIGYESNIESAIDAFVAYANLHFPMAQITVGCVGSSIPDLYNKIAPHYKHISDLGGRYISDLTFLMCDYQYYCPDDVHLTEAGYTFYKPYIINAILNGSVDYSFLVSYTLTLSNSNITAVGIGPSNMYLVYSPHMISCFFTGASAGYYVKFGNLDGINNLYTISHALKVPTTGVPFNRSDMFGTEANRTHIKGGFYFYLRDTTRLGCFINALSPDTSGVDFFLVYPNFSMAYLLYYTW